MGRLKIKETRYLHFYSSSQIKRVRLVKGADGVYSNPCRSRKFFTPPQPSPNSRSGSKKFTNDLGLLYVQFCIDVNKQENTEPSGNTLGLDMGLKEYYTDLNGLRLKVLNSCPKVKKSSNALNGWYLGGLKVQRTGALARQILGLRHLKISRQSYCTMQ